MARSSANSASALRCRASARWPAVSPGHLQSELRPSRRMQPVAQNRRTSTATGGGLSTAPRNITPEKPPFVNDILDFHVTFDSALNFLWCAIGVGALLALLLSERRKEPRQSTGRSRRLVAVFLTTVSLFPCVSATDDEFCFSL